MEKQIYIIFSATPSGMGGLIRLFTRNQYNHVSISLEEDMLRMYSFARYHHKIPLYGGFVEESILRYRSFQDDTRVKICALPVSEQGATYIGNYIQQIHAMGEGYIYNTPSALLSLLGKSIKIERAFTCVEFAVDVLARLRLFDLGGQRSCRNIRELEGLLSAHVIYEGKLPQYVQDEIWGEDAYPQETTTRYAVYTTARHFGRLAKRVILGVG